MDHKQETKFLYIYIKKLNLDSSSTLKLKKMFGIENGNAHVKCLNLVIGDTSIF